LTLRLQKKAAEEEEARRAAAEAAEKERALAAAEAAAAQEQQRQRLEQCGKEVDEIKVRWRESGGVSPVVGHVCCCGGDGL
jgi:hypothetical protein